MAKMDAFRSTSSIRFLLIKVVGLLLRPGFEDFGHIPLVKLGEDGL